MVSNTIIVTSMKTYMLSKLSVQSYFLPCYQNPLFIQQVPLTGVMC